MTINYLYLAMNVHSKKMLFRGDITIDVSLSELWIYIQNGRLQLLNPKYYYRRVVTRRKKGPLIKSKMAAITPEVAHITLISRPRPFQYCMWVPNETP